MIRALYSAASGMVAQQTNVENIANNLANANTNGFKTRRAQFQDLMYQSMLQPGAAAGQQTTVPAGLQLGLGTRSASNAILFTQGAFSETSNPLDLVIQGKGFFQVQLPNGELAYTRNGTFQLDKNGTLVTADGNPVQPQITFPRKHSRSWWRAMARSATRCPDRPTRSKPGRSSWPIFRIRRD
jgi:flagellar basal-body rod protein FlgG